MAEIVTLIGVVVWLASGGAAFAILAQREPLPSEDVVAGALLCIVLWPFMAGVALAAAILDSVSWALPRNAERPRTARLREVTRRSRQPRFPAHAHPLAHHPSRSRSPGGHPMTTDSMSKSSVEPVAGDWVMVPREPTPEMLAHVAVRVQAAGGADYDLAQKAVSLLPPSDHPDVADVLAELARDYRAMLSAAPASPSPAGGVQGVTEEMVERALAAFNEAVNDPLMVPCDRCDGKGYHHGFGEDGASPDWCTKCGGNQYDVVPGEEQRAMRLALRAALSSQAQTTGGVE